MSLHDDVLDAFGWPLDARPDDDLFNGLALRVFEHQYSHNSPYAAYCRRRDVTPERVTHWTQVPPLPAAAFREVPLVAGDASRAERVFRTSGTTRGAERRGEHHVLDLSIYIASLLPNFAGSVLADGARMRMLSLMPSSTELPESSLAFMIDTVIRELGDEASDVFASTETGLDEVALTAELEDALADDAPVCLLGTSLAFVHWLDGMEQRGQQYALPSGSRLMDTGGVKGSGREFSEVDLRERYARVLGLDAAYCINEYGMTEMCSQFYDGSLRDIAAGRPASMHKRVPPWVRSRIVDPVTLEPVAGGDVGILQHFDLANLNSVMALQTEDLAVAVGDGFRLLGRAPGATPRGCSIAMDILLQSLADR